MVPGLVLWAIRGRYRRMRSWQALAQRGRAPRDGTRLVIACAGCLILAMAQPRWGRLSAPPAPPGHDVVLMVDVSRSMAVEDAVPTRLGAAVEAAESLVNALANEASNRVAVVAFAGRGVLRCPLTENLGAVIDALHRLRPGSVQPGGTDLGAALDKAREAFGTQEHAEGRAIAVFSDGEDHLDRWNARIELLRDDGIVVHAVAIGDAEAGHPVPDGKSAQPLRYHGQPVASRRNDAPLETIARGTDGSIIRLGLASGDLGVLYRTKIEPAARQRRDAIRPSERAERFPLFLIAGLTFLIGACWPARRGWGWFWLWPWHWGLGRRWPLRKPLGAALFCMLLVLTAGASDTPAGPEAESPAASVARGQAAYRLQRWDDALEAFEAAIERAPASAVARYNAGATLFQLGRYEQARKYYLDARARAASYLRTKIDFALGNTALAQGDIPGAIRSYDECVASTARGADLKTVRLDAAANRRFALEQQQALTVPRDDSAGDQSKSRDSDKRTRPDRRGKGEDQSPEGQPEGEAGSGGSSAETPSDRDRSPSRRKRRGGAGGAQPVPAGARGDSPDDRLDAALENIRAAQKRRLPNDEPPPSADGDRKDW